MVGPACLRAAQRFARLYFLAAATDARLVPVVMVAIRIIRLFGPATVFYKIAIARGAVRVVPVVALCAIWKPTVRLAAALGMPHFSADPRPGIFLPDLDAHSREPKCFDFRRADSQVPNLASANVKCISVRL